MEGKSDLYALLLRLCSWLWSKRKAVWGTVIISILLNIFAALLFFQWPWTTNTKVAEQGSFVRWILDHPVTFCLCGVILLLLTGLVGLASRLEVKSESAKHLTLKLSIQNRQRLLKKVRDFWIDGVLKQSLYHEILLTLGLREQLEAVANPWRFIVQEFTQLSQNRSLPSNTRILEVYDDADGELLILGEPGSGKTTLLLELARNLLVRAEGDNSHPIPVIFNLSSWAVHRQPLIDWLIEELGIKYQVPRSLAQSWLDADSILPLLDGLDEVATALRSACIEAINNFHHQHNLVPIVVSSRSADYMDQTSRVFLRFAVVVQPLSKEQINDYLSHIGDALTGLKRALEIDPVLEELAATPLMLNVMTLAYQGVAPEEILISSSPDILRHQIFSSYVKRTINRRSFQSSYTPEQTINWLKWLAAQMIQHNQSVFYIELMQPSWLEDRSRRFYRGLVGGMLAAMYTSLLSGISISLFYGYIGLIASLAFGFIAGILYLLIRKINGILLGAFIGLIIGLFIGPVSAQHTVLGGGVFGVFIGVLMGYMFNGVYNTAMGEIKPAEVVTWSWKQALLGLILGLLLSVLVSILALPIFWIVVSMAVRQNGSFPIFSAISFIIFFVAGGTISTIILSGFSTKILEERSNTSPNRGIKRSVRNGVLFSLAIGVAFWFLFKLFEFNGIGLLIRYADLMDILVSVVLGITFGFHLGGMAGIQHYFLRLLLWQTGLIPWNYPRFLDYASERILLRKVGGGYIFMHRTLLEYFATLNTTSFPAEQNEQIHSTLSPS